MSKFKIRVDALWAAPMLLIGVREGTAYVEIDEKDLVIHFGVAEERIPLVDIGEPQTTEWSMFHGLGVRIGPDGVAYVGSTEGVVHMPLKKPHPFKVLFKITQQFSGLYLSIEDPEAFIAALRARVA